MINPELREALDRVRHEIGLTADNSEFRSDLMLITVALEVALNDLDVTKERLEKAEATIKAMENTWLNPNSV